MYVPEWFQIKSHTEIVRIIRENSFATLVSMVEGRLFATHVPLIVESDEPLALIGHIARQNPQSASLGAGEPHLAIFSGPHAYVSPQNYLTKPNVPTWNYVAVHATCRPIVLSAPEESLKVLEDSIATFDSNLVTEDPEYYRSKLKGIVAFRLIVTNLQAKAKLSQNKSEDDRDSVVRVLSESETELDRKTAAAMKAFALGSGEPI